MLSTILDLDSSIHIILCVLIVLWVKIDLASQPLLAFAAPAPSEALPSHAGDGRGGDSVGSGGGQQAPGKNLISPELGN